MSAISLSIDQWAAWAPGLESRDAWLDWLRAPHALPAEGQPALTEMPAMMRRRLDPLGRIALQAAYWAQGEIAVDAAVFASRWGEVARSEGMLEQLAGDEPLSPTVFSLSVHNAIGALYSIARKDCGNYLAVAAGPETAEASFVEAAGLLADGAQRVLLVLFDAPLPPTYQATMPAGETLPFAHAFACVLSRAEQGGIALRAEAGGADGGEPPTLQALRFLLGDAPELHSRGWHWSRRHA